jgi:uncharacterized NAD-dependent epimerase/dehydratase family protein
MARFKPTKVIGINLYSAGMSDAEGQLECQKLYKETGLPVEDMVRAPKGIIAEQVVRTLFPEMTP